MTQFYQRYPMMRPYIGTCFGESGTPSLLLIGESHYLPKNSSQHLRAESWYTGSGVTLSSSEIEWISTADIFRDQLERGFPDRPHLIWKNALREINDHGSRHEDYRSVARHIALYNFFLRPGLEGDSLKVERLDVEFANAAFNMHYETLRPSAIVFLSRLAFNHVAQIESISIPFIATPHPGCRWWNKASRRYGNKRGRDLLVDFVKAMTWRADSALPTPSSPRAEKS